MQLDEQSVDTWPEPFTGGIGVEGGCRRSGLLVMNRMFWKRVDVTESRCVSSNRQDGFILNCCTLDKEKYYVKREKKKLFRRCATVPACCLSAQSAQQNEVEKPRATPFPLQQATLTQQASAFMALLLTLQ